MFARPQPVRIACLLLALLAPLASTAALRAVAQAAGAPVTPPSQTAYLVQPEADQAATTVRDGYFWLPAAPGQTRTVHVVVKNVGRTPLRLRSYPVDSIQEPTGGIDFGTWHTPLARVGTWIRVSPATMTLAPGQTRRVTATMHVPLRVQGRTVRAGEYVGGLAFENEQTQSQGRGSHVLIDVHYRRVIAAVLVAPGPQRLAARVAGVTLAPTSVGSQATVALRNSGNVLLKGTGTVSVQGHGTRMATTPFALDTVLPAAMSYVVVALPRLRLRPGTYTVRLRLRSTTGASLLTWQRPIVVARAAVVTPRPILTLPSIQALGQTGQGTPVFWLTLTLAVLVLLLGLGLGVVVGRRVGGRRSV